VNIAGDQVNELSGAGSDFILASIDYSIVGNVEGLFEIGNNLTGTGSGGNDILVGIGSGNTLIGGNGKDTFSSIDGPNSLVGGADDDFYYVNTTGDQVQEDAVPGYDTVVSTVTYTLSDNVEKLVLTGNGSIDGTGNSGSNFILGSFGDNSLDGGGGSDAFAFLPSFGHDTINNFDVNSGQIGFDHSLFADVNDILAHTADIGGNAVITDAFTNSVTVVGVTKADLQAHSSDFFLF
jgi:Ca2+-binding RTX toxin-like protein